MCKGGGNRDESLNGVLDRRETGGPRGGAENGARRDRSLAFLESRPSQFREVSERKRTSKFEYARAARSQAPANRRGSTASIRARSVAERSCRTRRERQERTLGSGIVGSKREDSALAVALSIPSGFPPEGGWHYSAATSLPRPSPGPGAVCRCPRSTPAPLLLRLLVLLLVHVRPRISVGEKDGRQRVKALMGFYLRGSCPS